MLDETQSRPDISSAFINNVSKSFNSSMTEVQSTNESTSEAGEATSDVAASPSPGANVTIPAKRPASNEPSQVEVDTDAQNENYEDASSLEGSPLVDESPFVSRPPHQDIAEPTAIQVKLPRIICDITISQSLLGVLEQKRALLSTMKTTVNQILRTNLPSLYKYLGVLFDVQVVESASDLESPSLRRLHAFFNGTASFSPQGAHPTEQEIIKLLLAHFDVDAFSQSLRAPLRDRRLTASALAPHGSSDTVVKVNSVFFKVDGSLVLAGSMFDQVPSTSTSLTKQGDKGQTGQTVYALTFFVLVGEQEVNSKHLCLVLSSHLSYRCSCQVLHGHGRNIHYQEQANRQRRRYLRA